jgi:hypothetical protein
MPEVERNHGSEWQSTPLPDTTFANTSALNAATPIGSIVAKLCGGSCLRRGKETKRLSQSRARQLARLSP